jgi:hypothetical protein
MTPRRGAGVAADPSALRAALDGFVRTHPSVAGGSPEVARWENEGGPADTRAAQEAGDRALAASELGRWLTDPGALGDVDVALRAYTRDLRRSRVGLARTLAAVRAVFGEYLTPRLSHDGLAAVQRDVARSCLQAYFGP